MGYTLGEAAKRVGKSKTTLHRAIKSGRISASKADDGSYVIDPSELHRLFPPVTVHEPLQGKDSEQQDNPHETLRIQLEISEKERERERAMLQDMITDLREDRDKWRQQATMLLTDQKQRATPKGVFRRWFKK